MQLKIQLTTTVPKRNTVNGNIDNDLIRATSASLLALYESEIGVK